MGRAQAVFESVVGRPREHKVIRTKLVDVLKALHFWLVDEWAAVAGQLHRPVNDIVNCPRLQEHLVVLLSRHLIVHNDNTLLGSIIPHCDSRVALAI